MPSRKQFIESQGATCSNWNWSWSFVNHDKKVIIFGAWDVFEDGGRTLILSEDWATSRKGRKQAAYPQSREHIRLVEEEGYELNTFPIKRAPADESDELGPAKIAEFSAELVARSLVRVDNSWYATDGSPLINMPEEVAPNEVFVEGATREVLINTYERNSAARKKCLDKYGYNCAVCDFSFEKFYGGMGTNYIHVHHIVPISEIGKQYVLDPINDLIPVCPNCHAMLHSVKPALSIVQLRRIVFEKR